MGHLSGARDEGGSRSVRLRRQTVARRDRRKAPVAMGIILRANWGNSILTVRLPGLVTCGGLGDRRRPDGGLRNLARGRNLHESGSAVLIIGCLA